MKTTNAYYLKIETPRNMTMEKLKKKLTKQGHNVTLLGQRYGNHDSKIGDENNYGDIEQIVAETKAYGNYKAISFQYPQSWDVIDEINSDEELIDISIKTINEYDALQLNGFLLHAWKEQIKGDKVRKIAFQGNGFDVILSIDDIIPWRE